MKYIYFRLKYLGSILRNIPNVSMVNIHNHVPIWNIEKVVNIKYLLCLLGKNKLIIFNLLRTYVILVMLLSVLIFFLVGSIFNHLYLNNITEKLLRYVNSNISSNWPLKMLPSVPGTKTPLFWVLCRLSIIYYKLNSICDATILSVTSIFPIIFYKPNTICDISWVGWHIQKWALC